LQAKYFKLVKEYRELAAKYSELMNPTRKTQQGTRDLLEGNRKVVFRRSQAVRIASVERSNPSLAWKKILVSNSNDIVRNNPLVTVSPQNLFQRQISPDPKPELKPKPKLEASAFSFGQASQLTFAEPNSNKGLLGQTSQLTLAGPKPSTLIIGQTSHLNSLGAIQDNSTSTPRDIPKVTTKPILPNTGRPIQRVIVNPRNYRVLEKVRSHQVTKADHRDPIYVFTDGSYTPNTEHGGWGFFIDDHGCPDFYFGATNQKGFLDNHMCEAYAAKWVLLKLKEQGQCSRQIKIITDSQDLCGKIQPSGTRRHDGRRQITSRSTSMDETSKRGRSPHAVGIKPIIREIEK
jgi:ribonuclease HI